jgi:D-alanyl-D-alanine carboxypeptidase (penicillin-binding protein 5/6)
VRPDGYPDSLSGMTGWRVVAALAGAVLATPPGPPQTPTRPAYLPCPVVAPQAPVPPRPSPPAHDAGQPTIGGAGLATAGLTVPPGAPPLPATLSATSWLVADLDTGAVLGACGPHQGSPPASVQKLLLAETVLPKLDPAQVVEVTEADLAFERGSSAVGLLIGGHYSVETLWLGLLLQSGNDAANVLARLGGGSLGVPGTIDAMNAEAHRLGAYDTHAVTPSGLDGPGQFTSAYDLALVARADFAREDFRRYDTAPRALIPPQPPKDPRGFQIQNENDLLIRYPGALGGKTGFTDLARHTYVGAAQRNGRRLVVTVLGAEARPIRGWQQGAALLDWGFSLPADATVGHLVAPGEAERLRHPPTPSTAPRVAPAVLATRPAHGDSGMTLGGLGAAAAAIALTLVVIVVRARRRTVYRITVRRVRARR